MPHNLVLFIIIGPKSQRIPEIIRLKRLEIIRDFGDRDGTNNLPELSSCGWLEQWRLPAMRPNQLVISHLAYRQR